MTNLSREALVTEAEKVNADRMALIAWVKELEAVEKARYRYKFTPEARIWHKERAERFASLLSLLASEGEKVKELEARIASLMTCDALLCPYEAQVVELKADRDRLAAELKQERIKHDVACATIRDMQREREHRDSYAVLSNISSLLGQGLGDGRTSAAEYESRIREGIDTITKVEVSRREQAEAEVTRLRARWEALAGWPELPESVVAKMAELEAQR